MLLKAAAISVRISITGYEALLDTSSPTGMTVALTWLSTHCRPEYSAAPHKIS